MEKGFDILNWDGTISSTEFRIAAFAFAEKWNRFNSTRLPQWSWTLCPKHRWTAGQEAEGYLSLENVFLHGSKEDNEVSDVGKEEPGCSGQDEAIDGAILVQSCGDEIHWYDFHIVYSSSYRVPVLYFRGYCSDGQPLALDEIQKDLPGNSSKLLTESKWTFITQEEHPFLNRPWCNLHPCGTSEWMKLLLSTDACQAQRRVESENYLVSWLSVVGQVVGLRIPFEMLNGSGCFS